MGEGSMGFIRTIIEAPDPQWEIGLLVAIAVGFLVYRVLLYLVDGPRLPLPSRSAIEGQFRNVFAVMDEPRRQSLVRYYMQKYECGREEAMRHAMDDRERDQHRYS